MNIGIDLTQISDLQKKLSSPGLAEKVYTDGELNQNNNIENLAGIFAAKEAFFKAFGQKLDWRQVWVEKLESGKPEIHSTYLTSGQKAQVSISHGGDYAVAIVMIE